MYLKAPNDAPLIEFVDKITLEEKARENGLIEENQTLEDLSEPDVNAILEHFVNKITLEEKARRVD